MRRTTKAGIIVIANNRDGCLPDNHNGDNCHRHNHDKRYPRDKVRNLWEGYIPTMSISQHFSMPQSIAVEHSPSAEYPAQVHASSHVRQPPNLHCSCLPAVDDCNKEGRYVVRNLCLDTRWQSGSCEFISSVDRIRHYHRLRRHSRKSEYFYFVLSWIKNTSTEGKA